MDRTRNVQTVSNSMLVPLLALTGTELIDMEKK